MIQTVSSQNPNMSMTVFLFLWNKSLSPYTLSYTMPVLYMSYTKPILYMSYTMPILSVMDENLTSLN